VVLAVQVGGDLNDEEAIADTHRLPGPAATTAWLAQAHG
jgi:hypothetical protein